MSGVKNRATAAAVGIAAWGLVACAVRSADFDMSEVEAGEAAVAGRLHVDYNGTKSTEDCSACFNGSNDCVIVDEDGYIFHTLEAGRNAFVEVRCQRDSSPYHYSFEPRYFDAVEGRVTYIGDLYVQWRTEGGYKTSQLFGAIGAAADESSNDGTARLRVEDHRERTIEAFGWRTGSHDESFHVSLAGGGPDEP